MLRLSKDQLKQYNQKVDYVEELLKEYDKKKDKLFKKNVLASKYIYCKGQKFIYKLITKGRVRCEIQCITTTAINSYTMHEILNYFEPLNKEHVKKIIENRRIEKFSKDIKNKVKFCYNQAVKVYGESNVDVWEEEYLIIYFKEKEIRNSRGSTHLLRDIYVVIGISSGKIRLVDVKRSSFTQEEYSSNYLHSHVDTTFPSAFNSPNEVCLGTDTPMRFLQQKFIVEKMSQVRDFTQYLFLIEEFLAWESLEGTPWKHIETIKTMYENSVSNVNFDGNKAVECVLSKLDEIPYVYEKHNNQYTISLIDIDDKISDILKEFMPSVCFYDEGGISYTKIKNLVESIDEKLYFTFKGNDIPINIIKSDKTNVVIKPHQQVINYVKETIKKELLNHLISKKV